MDFFLSLFLSFVFFYFYYKLLWLSSKIRSKELKLVVKYGKGSEIVEKFRSRFVKFYHSKLFRFSIFSLFAFGIFELFGKKGFLGFAIALLVSNLTLILWGWFKTEKPNGGSFSQTR